MLARTSYPADYLDTCRTAMRGQLESYRNLLDTARGEEAVGDPNVDDALDSFEPALFKNLVLALDHMFAHRQRSLEGTDGNALNEVRILSASILENNGVLLADQQIRLDPSNSVLGYSPGDTIKLDADDFAQLSERFFDAIAERYPA